MKMHTIKTKIANKTKVVISVIVSVVSLFLYSLRYDTVARLVTRLLFYLPLVFSFILALLPIVLTIVFIRLVVIIHKDQSTVDYLTYVDQSMLNQFNWDEDPVNHIIVQVERRRVAIENESAAYASGLLPQARDNAPKYSLDDIADIPDYDPNGPSPFKKM